MQVHSLVCDPKKPHGQGFILAINMKLQGYVIEELSLLIVTLLSSKGPRKTSIVDLLNSGNSSKNKTPL